MSNGTGGVILSHVLMLADLSVGRIPLRLKFQPFFSEVTMSCGCTFPVLAADRQHRYPAPSSVSLRLSSTSREELGLFRPIFDTLVLSGMLPGSKSLSPTARSISSQAIQWILPLPSDHQGG